MPAVKSRRIQADLALALCALIWGATFVVVKDALAAASVFVFNALRFSLAAAVMALVYWRALRKMDRATFFAGALIGCFMFGGYTFQTLGLKFTTPSKAAFITGAGVVMVPVLLAIFWKRRVHRWVWAGALAALVGLYYLTVPRSGFEALNVGDFLALGCAVMFALHIIVIGRYSSRHSVGALSLLQVGMTALFTSLCLPVLDATRWEPPRLHWTPNLVFAVLITAVGATALCFSLQVWAQQYTTPTHTAILISLEPVFAALTSVCIAHEVISRRVLLGAALVFIGILLAEMKGPAQSAADSPGPVSDVSLSQ
ncbi:MAG TPA: DMT family transporter [Candidatus Acidoferrales bacterium]|nr:DMT family transporter [Candidatus Acidoferrales bacterium]